MLSRVADSLYWMSRYLERAEHTSRVLDVHQYLMLDQVADEAHRRWLRVLDALNISSWEDDQGLLHPRWEALTFDPNNGSSIVASIGAARENARQIREQISSEMFEELNRLYLQVRGPEARAGFQVEPHAFYQAVKDGAHLFQGITDATMTHGQGWMFIQVGRHLERATSLTTLLISHLVPLVEGEVEDTPRANYLEQLGLLKSCTAWEAYCKVYSAALVPRQIAEFLLLSRDFPHSVYYCVKQLSLALHDIAADTGVRQSKTLERSIERLRSSLRFTPIEEILEGSLKACLLKVRERLLEVNNGLYRVYITDPHFEF